MTRLLKKPEIRTKLGNASKHKLRDFVAAGRLVLVPIGERLHCATEESVDTLIAELAVEGEAAQMLIDAGVDLGDNEGCERVLNGKTYPPTSRPNQQRFLVDRAVRMALDLQRGQAFARKAVAAREAKALHRPRKAAARAS